MSLNIKNDATCKRVAELARITGESMTKAVDEAVRQRIESLGKGRKGALTAQLLAIGKDCAARLKKPFRQVEHGDLLYGEDGLPK
jgi:antitoxin VapB